ncbi:uncharacterized protein G2W53_029418 [Senna tora]|uniref:Uncharacterized protein n=1 Tax=Senna tora TaxID=362788 RepID=A0A834WFQ6_9FABA|nr:uncharacterized protein G2W53_029418 [Senna tora]
MVNTLQKGGHQIQVHRGLLRATRYVTPEVKKRSV